MRVAMYYNNSDIRTEQLPKPKLGEGEVLIKVEASGICGSDLMEWYRVPKAPLVLGHEVTGEIVELDSNVKDFKLGDRVVVTHHVPCNTCDYCLSGRHTLCEFIKKTSFDPGGFSEYLRIPKINVECGMFVLPDGLSYEEGSFVEPLGCVVRALNQVGLNTGESVAIIGSGITGLLNLQYVVSNGAGFVTSIDINDYKLQKAIDLGANLALDATSDVKSEILKNNSNKLVDLVIVCIGVDSAIKQAFEIVEKGGKILFFAPSYPEYKLNIPFNDYWWSGVSMYTSYAASPGDMKIALDLISNKRINVADMITDRLSLEETQKGFDLLRNAKESLKIIINPNL